MRAIVNDDEAGADRRHHTECSCQTCRRLAALAAGSSRVDNIEPDHDVLVSEPYPQPEPRHNETGRYLSPLDTEDGHSLWDMR